MPAPLAQAAGAGDERCDAFAALDAQHMAAVDDGAAAGAERLQGMQQRGAARRIGELARARRLGPDLDERRSERERRGGSDRSSRIDRALHEEASGIGVAHHLGAIEGDGALGEHGDSAQSGLQRANDRAGADGRHVDAHLLARLGTLDQHATPAPDAALGLATLQGEPCQHGIGVLGAFDGLDASVGNDHRLPDIEWSQRAHDIEAARNVDHLARLRPRCAERAFADEQRGQHVDRRDDLEALAFEETYNAAQHAVVACGGNDARDSR